MKRDKTGKFIQTWDKEPKQAVKLSLTKTAWQILQQQACDRNMSRSELVEHYARSLQSISALTSAVDESKDTLREFHSATQTYEPADVEIEARVASRTVKLHQTNTQLQERVVQLEQELQQQTELQANQRQWLEAILNLLPTPLILIDREAKRVTFSNQAANRLAGGDLSSDRIAGVYNEDYHCTDETGQIIPPDQLPSARAARGEKIHGLELNWHNPTGIYPLLVYVDTLPAMHDRPTTGIVVFQDISEHKQMEVELRESNRRITNILESITDAFIAVDRNWRITYANQEAARLNGKQSEELIGLDAWEEGAALKGTKTEQEYRRAMTQGVPVHFEEYYASFDLWVENHAYPSPDGLNIFFRDITQRKRIEEALRQSETCFRTVLDNIPDTIALYDAQLRVKFLNAKGIQLTGRPLDEILGRTDQELWPAEVTNSYLPLLYRAVETRTPQTQECNIVLPNIAPLTLVITYIPLLDEQGEIQEILAITYDITERKRSEAALQQIETRLARLAENIPGVIYQYRQRPNGNDEFIYISSGCLELYGFEFWEIQQNSQLVWQAIHPDDLEAIQKTFTPEVLAGAPWRHEWRIIDRSGELKWIQGNSRCEREPDGSLLWDGVLLDISDVYDELRLRKRAEAVLRESEERYRRLFEHNPQPMWMFDDQTLAFLAVNEAAIHHYGYSKAEFLAMTIRDIRPPEDIPALLNNIARTPAQVDNAGIWRHIKKDGTLIEVEITSHAETFAGRPAWLIVINDVTERKQTERALRESEERFRTLADNIAQLAWMADENGWLFWYNQRWFDYTGTTFEEMEGWGWQKVHHPEHLERVVHKYRHCVETGETWEDTFPLRNKHGEYRWFLSRAIPIQDKQGKVFRWFGTNTDITERKQVETALRQRQQRLDLATNVAGLGVFEWDAQTDCAFWENQRMYQIFGQSPEDGTISKEQFVNSILHPDDLECFEQALGEAMQPGNRFHLLCRIRRKDGEWRWIEFNGCFSHAPDGTPLRLVSVISDITDRKLAEAALRQSEERYRYLAQLIPQLVWIANDEGVLLDVNQRWLEFTGLTLEQAQIQGWRGVVHPDDISILSHRWAAAQQNTIRYQAEGRMRRVDGVYRWHLHQALPWKNEQGQVVKWFGTATDIEDQKQLEQQRDREAAERHRILQEEQKARAEAERANRIKDEFLAVLSHELRSPLNPILGWSRLLQTRKFDQAKTNEALKVIERNAKLQVELIEDLLDVSRILRGKLSLNVTPVDLASTIRAAMETVRLAAEAKSIQVTTRFEPNVGKVAGDSSRLQQVVWNILSNAIKFTPTGGQIHLWLERVEGDRREIPSQTSPASPSSYAQITVTDTGKGISPDFLPHVFDYFRQADSTTTRTFGGLGLGLAIVHHLVELHGGTVQASSPGEGQGATFTVKLPLMPTQPQTNPDSQQIEQSRNLNGIKVLVVDDDADSGEFATFVLEQEGANVAMASSATEALAALIEFKPDILLSDIGMPDVDGYMLIQQVRALPPEQGGTIKAIALTAYAGEVNYQQALSAGFQHHLSKPVEPAELVAVVASLIQHSN